MTSRRMMAGQIPEDNDFASSVEERHGAGSDDDG